MGFALGILQIFVGIGAVVSGGLLVAAPSGKYLQTPPDMLAGSPFHDFLVPGLILILVNGVGQLAAGVLTFRRHPAYPFAGMVFGLGLMIWIFVQVNMIGGGHWLQFSYFALGVVESALSFLLQWSRPLNDRPM
jgi:hypothetical protein